MTTSRTVSAKNKKVGMRDGAFGGFTIIEVVLVLAIAGLIFLMVFIALPQLQRAQRDTQRREDMGRLASAVTQFQTNNNGNIPGQKEKAAIKCDTNADGTMPSASTNDACRMIATYMNAAGASENAFKDPDGTPYSLTIMPSGTLPDGGSADGTTSENGAVNHMIYMYTKAKCDGETISDDNAQPRDYAIVYKLEGSGTYCGGSSN